MELERLTWFCHFASREESRCKIIQVLSFVNWFRTSASDRDATGACVLLFWMRFERYSGLSDHSLLTKVAFHVLASFHAMDACLENACWVVQLESRRGVEGLKEMDINPDLYRSSVV